MSGAWVAGTVRAKALAGSCLTDDELARVAAEDSVPGAIRRLCASTHHRDLTPELDLLAAEHAVAGTLLWRLRVLAGWTPTQGTALFRVLAAGFEIANVDNHLAQLRGQPTTGSFDLGTLETAWSRVRGTRSRDALRSSLAASAWGDPGSSSARGIHLVLSLTWLQWITASVPDASGWARRAAALVVLREAVLDGPLPTSDRVTGRVRQLLGPRAADEATAPSASFRAVVRSLPPQIRPGPEATTGEDLWRAERALVDRVRAEGTAMMNRGRYGPAPVVGAVALLACDAWRARSALEAAARHPSDPARLTDQRTGHDHAR